MNGFQTFFTIGDFGAHAESPQPQEDNSSSSYCCCSEYEDSQAPVTAATTSGASESATEAAASTADDCWEVCLVAPRAGFALVPCGHAWFCESSAMRVSYMAVGCPVCGADITMIMRIFSDDRLCQSTLATISLIIYYFCAVSLLCFIKKT